MNIRGILLLPISLIYGFITLLRNKLFDWGIFRSVKHPINIISVGNLSMGGTGKTPHVEYLIRLIKDRKKIATLSRGYGRKTKGFILANDQSTATTIGDEPLQYYHKFKDITVAVDEKRNHGTKKLLEIQPDIDLIILDDAFQHRWIQRDLSILLTDYHKLYHENFMAPSGDLREFARGAKRADLIIVTKTPITLSPFERRGINEDLKIKSHQHLLFSKISYDGFFDIYTHQKTEIKISTNTIILFTGIANPYPLKDHLKQFCKDLVVLDFPDHHQYNDKDLQLIIKTYNDQFTSNKLLITTEKDAQRLSKGHQEALLLNCSIYYVPIHIEFHDDDEDVLIQAINALI